MARALVIIDLDAPSGRDPVRVGGKAAPLAAARAAGAAVLPGFVVAGSASRDHMRLGAVTLPERGSGGARLAVSGEPVDFAEELAAAGRRLGDRLVARSSTLLESSGQWSGAFTSYVDIGPADLPKAVVGCWASAFSVAALERQKAAGVVPGSFPMSVLVQPALEPEAGGWATISDGGTVVVHGVKGPPAPLMQGWATGHRAHYDGSWSGDELIELLGVTHLDSIRSLLHRVATGTRANRCEWALTDRVWALQLGMAPTPAASERPVATGSEVLPELVDFVRTVVLAPGALGEEAVLPWAVAGLPGSEPSMGRGPVTVDMARGLCRELTEEVWGLPWDQALSAARRVMGELGGGDHGAGVATLRRLRPPDPGKAARLLGILKTLRLELVARGVAPDEDSAWHLDLASIGDALQGGPVIVAPRVGIGRWEPLVAAVILSTSSTKSGTAASPGFRAGRRAHVADPHQGAGTRRGVITAPNAIPNLASLLWDSAGLVTTSGSPAAHLFEAARALRVPAVCGLDLGDPRDEVVAVDGFTGTVATLTLDRAL